MRTRCPTFALIRVARLEMTPVAFPHTTLACGDFPDRTAPGCAACGEAADLMPWARIDDGFDDHPKVLALLDHDDGAAALGLWVLCLTWAHRNTRKKGKIPGRVPLSLPRRYLGVPGRDAAKLLVDAGLWDLAEDGWDIHDFDQYLPTAETSSARSAAGKKGAATRWGKKGETAAADSNEPSGDSNLLSGAMASDGNGMASDGRVMAPGGDETPAAPPGGRDRPPDSKLPFSDSNEPSGDSKRIASDGSRAPARRAISKEIAPIPVPTPSTRPTDSPPGSPARAKAARATRIADDFAVTAEMAEWARCEVPALIAAGRGQSETDRFIDHWRQAAGPTSKKLDWVAAWRNWMRRASDELGGSPARGLPARPAPQSGSDRALEQGEALKAQIRRGEL